MHSNVRKIILTRKESKEAMGTTVDDIYFMKSNCMNHLFPFLKFAFRALNKPGNINFLLFQISFLFVADCSGLLKQN